MIGKLFAFILSGYSGSTVEIQNKARILLIILVLIFCTALILSLFSLLFNLMTIFFLGCVIFLLISFLIVLLKLNQFQPASIITNIILSVLTICIILTVDLPGEFTLFVLYTCLILSNLFIACLISNKLYSPVIAIGIGITGIIVIGIFKIQNFMLMISKTPVIEILLSFSIFGLGGIYSFLIVMINKNIFRVMEEKSKALSLSNDRLNDKSGELTAINTNLKDIINNIREILIALLSVTKEIETSTEKQKNASIGQASGITEVSTTLEELSITAKQIAKNTNELVVSSGNIVNLLKNGETKLLNTVSQIEEVGSISKNNVSQIENLSKKSVLINEMVGIIKDVANKTNMLSINASIEASRSGKSDAGFSVVASEIRELSKETLASAKNVEHAAGEIRNYIDSIIQSSEGESERVSESGKTIKEIYTDMENILTNINNNYSFTQKIDISVQQQESGSKQAAETMKQMSEISRQSAEIIRQTADAMRDIVDMTVKLDGIIKKYESG